MKISNLHDLVCAVEHAEKIFVKETWWRGQPQGRPLLSGIHRPDLCPRERQDRCEKDLARRFLLGARTRHGQWPEGDYVLQLAMMQHYRLPTRLLDWTESPLFALFFAVKSADDEPGVLWALSPSNLNKAEFQVNMLMSPYQREDIQLLFRAPFVDSDKNTNKVAAVLIRHIDIRQTVQLSVFTIHGNKNPLDEYTENERFLIKFEIPAESKKLLRLELFAFGIRESNIFPDLDHLADELRTMTREGLI